MSDERFILCKKGDKEYIEDNGCIQLYGFDVLCEMLNEFNDENRELKKENANMNLFIKQTIQPLLFDCVFELCTIESMSQVELAKKIENEIIPFIQDFKYIKYEEVEK